MTSEASQALQQAMQAFEAAWQAADRAALNAALSSLQQIDPAHAWTHFARGMLARLDQQPRQAISAFEAALRAEPQSWEAWLVLGQLQLQQSQLTAAIQSLAQASRLRPDCLSAWESLVRALLLRGDHTTLQALLQDLLHPDWPGQLPQKHLFDPEHFQRLRCIWASYYLLNRFAQPDCTQAEINALLARWGQSFPASQPPALHLPSRKAERPLHIGWVSNEWFSPVAQRIFWPLLAFYDASNYTVTVYADDAQSGEMPARPRALKQVHHSKDWDTEQFCRQIHADAIDILVDLSGLFNPLRLDALRCRPAPLQISAATNPPFSSGLPEVSWRWSDKLLSPPEMCTAYLEQTHYLPSFIGWQAPPESPEPVAPPCLHNGFISFGALASANKLNAEVLQLWGQLLARLPEAQLHLKSPLYADPPSCEAILQSLTAAGCQRRQIHFESGDGSLQGQLAFLKRCDILLDSFPYAGALSTCDAFWMGVPVLSLRDSRRLAQCMHQQVGTASAWLADSPEHWLALGQQAARQPAQLNTWRQQLRPMLLASPIGQIEQHAAEQQASYRQIWRQWCLSDYNS
ncbi:MAG: tetratricopeptide repeat protein [Candidatus Sericytochromatia bacterium]|nr:tetratricopeptide repeat protein [Candidatus Sericytochromatia bacterium]